ncbi:hypothetical protein OF83DRAFT_631468 [Amylostereum chailletii]|nr:hypothetical protein OF83DRAFT_631468 [Amylostereum chailletii]
MAASKRLRPYYVVAKFEVVAVPSSPRSINVDLSRSAVEKAVLWASGPSELSEDTLADACDAIANFRLSPSAGPNPHCECSLIAFLRRTQTVTIPYIGVSKLSCLACHCYIEAYNTTLSPPSPGFQTAGCHGCYIAGWVPPSVGLPDQDLQIETSMVARLRSMFAGHLSTIETRNRTQSQSTAASSGSRTGTLRRPSDLQPSGVETYLTHLYGYMVVIGSP